MIVRTSSMLSAAALMAALAVAPMVVFAAGTHPCPPGTHPKLAEAGGGNGGNQPTLAESGGGNGGKQPALASPAAVTVGSSRRLPSSAAATVGLSNSSPTATASRASVRGAGYTPYSALFLCSMRLK